MLQAVGAKIVPVKCDTEGIVVDLIPDDARVIYVTPSHQFPRGSVMTASGGLECWTKANRLGAIIFEVD